MNALAKRFSSAESYWDFMSKFGMYQGSKDEATHYKTLGDKAVFLKVEGDQIYFWTESGGYWQKTHHYTEDCITLIGQEEPVIYGPPKPERIVLDPAPIQQPEIYSTRKYKGD